MIKSNAKYIFTYHIFSDGLQTYIRKEEKWVFITNPDNFHFLRFNTVFLYYGPGSQSIDEKLHLLQNQLQLFKTVFSDLKEINLSAKINQNDQRQFRNHSQLLGHLREQVLPICNSSSFYSFHIDFQSENDGAANFIAQILQMCPINRGREVYFHYTNETFIQLPVEDISNWLNRNSDDGIGCTGTGQSKKELKIALNNRIRIQNAVEMCDHMKMVITFYFIFGIKIWKRFL